MTSAAFITRVCAAIATSAAAPSYQNSRRAFLVGRIERMTSADVAKLPALPAQELDRLLATAPPGTAMHAQQLAHARWLYTFLHGVKPHRAPRPKYALDVPVSTGVVRITGITGRLTPGDVQRITAALELWQDRTAFAHR